jgi:hypothetical protein
LSQILDSLLDAWSPWMTDDLGDYADAISVMYADVELYAFDTVDPVTGDEIPGWAVLLDPDLCPAPALPYLAQYVGERLPVGISEPLAREWIKDNPNAIRGTVRSQFYAAQRKLTGTRLVSVMERFPDVDHLTIVTYTSQTPDPAGTLRDLQDVVAFDTILVYETLDGQLWNHVKSNYATWADVKTHYATWADVAADLSGSSVFSRPAP